MTDKEAPAHNEIIRAMQFEKKRSIFRNSLKRHITSGLPKIHLIWLYLRQIFKPFIVRDSDVEFHKDHQSLGSERSFSLPKLNFLIPQFTIAYRETYSP